MNKKLGLAAFLLGLIAVAWVAAGYVNGHPLALTMTLLIAAVYIAGGVELGRFDQATSGLHQALRALPGPAHPAPLHEPADPPASLPTHPPSSTGIDLPSWLAQLPQALRNAVRLRIAGERVGLPGPTMTPYLVGLLVLLGMLGTFLGMVVTLQGATSALESTTDVAALRAALSAPVRGLGLAFGTSVAGVAASSMLGLVSALCRRQRLQAAQLLDAHIAGSLRVYTPAHQREQAAQLQQQQLKLQQEQLVLLQQNRDLAEQGLQAQRQAIELRQQTLQKLEQAQVQRKEGLELQSSQLQQHLQHAQQQAQDWQQQQDQHRLQHQELLQAQQLLRTQQAQQAQLAQEQAQAQAHEQMALHAAQQTAQQAAHHIALQAVQASVQASVQESAQRAQTLAKQLAEEQVQHQARLQTLTSAEQREAQNKLIQLQEQQRAQQASHQAQLLQALHQQTRALPEATAHMQALMAQMAQLNQQGHEQQLASQDQFHSRYQASAQATFTALAASVDDSLKTSLTQSALAAGAAIAPAVATTMAGITRETAAFQRLLADSVQAQLDGVSSRLDAAVSSLSSTWEKSADQQNRASQQQMADLQTALTAWSAQFEKQSAGLLQTVQHSHQALQTHTSSSDQQRLAAWTQAITTLASNLHQSWQEAGTQAQVHNAHICQTLENTARQMQAQAETHARSTVNEVTRLLDTAAEAPRVAAEVVGQLRQQLSDSLARDNTLLDERARIMETMAGLLDTVNRAATEQRSAIDTLVASSATVLQQTSAQLGQQLEDGTNRLASAAAHVSGGALEVASLGDAFGAAVQLFGQSSEALAAQLQRIELALDKSSSRSDEQLAYYVAQAREIIDLSLSSQKQVVDELQRVARQAAPAPAATGTAPAGANEAA